VEYFCTLHPDMTGKITVTPAVPWVSNTHTYLGSDPQGLTPTFTQLHHRRRSQQVAPAARAR
jgi:hypothetical protein